MTTPRPIGRPTETALWACVETTLRRAVLPAIDDAHTRQVVIQLVGLAAYARERGDDPTGERIAALAHVLDGLAERATRSSPGGGHRRSTPTPTTSWRPAPTYWRARSMPTRRRNATCVDACDRCWWNSSTPTWARGRPAGRVPREVAR